MSDKFKLVGHHVVPVEDLFEWARWFETAKCKVAYDTISPGVQVSTVFLGLDHNFGMAGRPILFKTVVFGGPLDGEQERYHTWDEAEQGHRAMVERAASAEPLTSR